MVVLGINTIDAVEVGQRLQNRSIDGNTVISGEVAAVLPNGNFVVANDDGSATTYDSNGAPIGTTFPDGTQILQDEEGNPTGVNTLDFNGK